MRFTFNTFVLSVLVLLVGITSANAQPAAPTLSIEPAQPRGLDDVTLVGSAANNVASATFELAADAAFTKKYQTFVNNTVTLQPGETVSRYLVDNDRFPVGIPLYARAAYTDANGAVSPWSNTVTINLGTPAGLKQIYSNDFENVPVDQVPEGWEVFSTTDDTGPQGSYYNPELSQWVVKDVEFLNALLYYPSYGDPGVVETDLKITDGKTLVAESGDYVDAQNFYESHIITHEFNFSNVTDIVVAFNSNYVQNGDNIAILEYTLDKGSVDVSDGAGLSGLPKGTWYPIMYYFDSISDIILDANGNIDVQATLDGQDEKGVYWRDYIFAEETVGDEEVVNYILPRLDDEYVGEGGVGGEYDSKRWERFRVPNLDNKPSVKFRFMFQGSWSWFWTIDNFQIWGNDGSTEVKNWAIFE